MSESDKSKKELIHLLSQLKKEINIDTDLDEIFEHLESSNSETNNLSSSNKSMYIMLEFVKKLHNKFESNNESINKLNKELKQKNEELKNTYEKISSNEEKYRLLFTNMINGFSYQKIILNGKNEPVDYLILEINDAFEKMLNIKREDLIGKRISEICPDIFTDTFNWISAYGNVALTGKPLKIERYFEPVGRWYSIYVYSPKREYFATIFEDITERKRYDKKLIKITNKLMDWNKDLKSFVYATSHDLKEPIRIISNYVEILDEEYTSKLSKNSDDELKIYFDVIKNAIDKMFMQITNLGNYFNVENFGYVEAKEKFTKININKVIKSALDSLKDKIKQSNAKITVDNNEMPNIYINPLQIKVLFINLIDNALKFSNKERPEVHISAKKENEGWLFFVKDNGIGISYEYFDRIFEVFKTLHSKEKFKGSGLGLAICKKIIKNHNGRIWVRSKMNKGSTFYFTIKKQEKLFKDLDYNGY